MKPFLLLFLFAFSYLPLAKADQPEGQTLFRFPWDTSTVNGAPHGIVLPPNVTARVVPDGPASLDAPAAYAVAINYTGQGDLKLKLIPFPDDEGFDQSLQRIVTHHYALTGEIRCKKISPGSYLEMMSYFGSPAPGYPEAGAFFSRTPGADGPNGPMGHIDGASDWREFTLPFDSTDKKAKLLRLEMNLCLTGPSTVYLRNLKLMQYPAETPAPQPLDIYITSTPDRGAVYSVSGGEYLPIVSIQSVLKGLHDSLNPFTTTVHVDKTVDYKVIAYVIDQSRAAGAPIKIVPSPDLSITTPGQPPALPFDQVAAITTAQYEHALKVTWFWIGVGATTSVLFILAGCAVIFHEVRKKTKEQELRRIASLDS